MGVTASEILELAGGMRSGVQLRAYLPGGASTSFLAASQTDVPLDFDAVGEAGSRLGTGMLILLDDHTCPVGICANLEKFFAVESCGWCTPCREGLPWTRRVLEGIEQGEGQASDVDLLREQCRRLGPGRTFCALAPGAAAPLQSALELFEEDFRRHIEQGRCPWEAAA